MHALLELFLRHLAVRDQETKAWAEVFELLPHLVDRLHPVVEIERLPTARMLSLERHLDQRFVVLPDGGSDRSPAGRRRLDDRDVTQPRERHVERARNGCRGESKHVDLEPKRPEELLLADTETLLLVEDDEAEVLRV